MNLKTKIAIALISPFYFSLLIIALLFSFTLGLVLKILNFSGILSGIEFWLLKTRQLFVMWEFRKGLSKEDKEVLDMEDDE